MLISIAVWIGWTSSYQYEPVLGMDWRERETVSRSVAYRGTVWTAKRIFGQTLDGDGTYEIRLFCGGRNVTPEEYEGIRCDIGDLGFKGFANVGFAFIYSPDQEVYLSVESHSGAGHGRLSHIYSLPASGKPRLIYQTTLENGGPVFRDIDEDGRCEWIFDDYNYYDHYGEPGPHILVYKNSPDGELRLHQELPNRFGVFVKQLAHEYVNGR